MPHEEAGTQLVLWEVVPVGREAQHNVAGWGPLKRCPKCDYPGGLIRCLQCHGPYPPDPWQLEKVA